MQEDEHEQDVQLFGFWNMCLIAGNIFNLFCNLIIFFNEFTANFQFDSVEHIINILLAFGCLLAWINVLYILSLFENFNIVNKTLANSAPGIFWFSLGIAPIFLAFVFSGFCMFHEGERFQDLINSYLSLMCLFAADEYQGFFLDTDGFPLNELFFYLYGFVVLIVISNVFVFIIESGYSMELRNAEKRKLKAKE